MKLRALHLKNFGAFKDRAFQFEDGFNHISLKNEGGKSTVVEAINVGFFDYSQKKNYAYLPNLVGECSMAMELSLEGLDTPITVERSNLKRTVSGYLKKGLDTIEVDRLTLAEIIGTYCGPECEIVSKKIHNEDFILDGENISQQEDYIKASQKSDISYVQALDYRGRSIEELIDLREERKKVIYTNSSNSKSDLAKLRLEWNEMESSREELEKINAESSQNYDSFQEKSVELEGLNVELERGEARLKELEREIRECELLEDYRDLKRRKIEKNFRALQAMPLLRDYAGLQHELNLVDAGLSQLKSRQKNISFTDEERTLLGLRKLELEGEVNLTSNFTKLFRADELLSKKEGLEESLRDLGYDGEGLNIDEARAELSSYEARLKEMEGLSEAEKKNPYSLLIGIMALGSVCMAYLFKDSTLLALLSLGLLFLSLILAGVFYSAKRRDDKYKVLRKRELESEIVRDCSELKKIEHFRIMLSEYRRVESTSYQFMERVLRYYAALEALKSEEKELRDSAIAGLSSSALSSFLLDMGEEERLNYAEFYLRRSDALWEKRREGLELEAEIGEGEESRLKLLSRIKEVENYYLREFHTKEADEIQRLVEEGLILDVREKELLGRASELNLNLEEPGPYLSSSGEKREEYEALSLVLEAKKKEGLRLKDEIIELKSGLKMGPKLKNHKYSDYNVEELKALEEANLRSQQALLDEYNRLCFEVGVLREMDLILKERMKPKFIQKAAEYFKIIAPDSDFRLDMSEKGSIIFVNEESQVKLPFKNLSTATRAQIILCIKLANLDENDENKAYPLIIDDAFMSYDKRRYEGALELLKHIAEERQVVYFAK